GTEAHGCRHHDSVEIVDGVGQHVGVGRRVQTTVDETTSVHDHGIEQGRDGARGGDGAADIDGRPVVAAEDHALAVVEVDGAHPQRPVRPGATKAGAERGGEG